MKEWQYNEIINFLKEWVKKEGLYRFCDMGRSCDWSRRGRQECRRYIFANEMDCFHLWIACFDKGVVYREGYDGPDDYPWKNETPEKDIPPWSSWPKPDEKMTERQAKTRALKRRKYDWMQELEEIETRI